MVEDREEELARLISEQERDIKQGDHQSPEPGVVSYNVIDGDLEEFIGLRSGKHRDYPECAYHGRANLRLQPGTFNGWACRTCEAEAARKYASRVGRKVLAERTEAWRKANPERNAKYQREYKKRRWHEDAEWREKQLARQRAYRARRKAETA